MNIIEYTAHDPNGYGIFVSAKERTYNNDRVVSLFVQSYEKLGTASLYTKVKNPVLQINNEDGKLHAQIVLELDPAFKPYKVTAVVLLSAAKTEDNRDTFEYKITITGAK